MRFEGMDTAGIRDFVMVQSLYTPECHFCAGDSLIQEGKKSCLLFSLIRIIHNELSKRDLLLNANKN